MFEVQFTGTGIALKLCQVTIPINAIGSHEIEPEFGMTITPGAEHPLWERPNLLITQNFGLQVITVPHHCVMLALRANELALEVSHPATQFVLGTNLSEAAVVVDLAFSTVLRFVAPFDTVEGTILFGLLTQTFFASTTVRDQSIA